MPRHIESHKVNELNKAINIIAIDDPNPETGASHVYAVELKVGEEIKRSWILQFQKGPVATEKNGLTHEALLAVVIDRLNGFQKGPFGCAENEDALMHLEYARSALGSRTRLRQERGIEGTHQL